MAEKLIIVLGKGRSGTRMVSYILRKSGVSMGRINKSGDYIGRHFLMYRAAKECAKRAKYLGNYEWDYTGVMNVKKSPIFSKMKNKYLGPILRKKGNRGWKLPETTLAAPLITKEFPDAYYICIVRNPRDAIRKSHITDDLKRFCIPFDGIEGKKSLLDRAVSWKFQFELMTKSVVPNNSLLVRFEDLVMDQRTEVGRMSEFLDMDLSRIAVKKNVIGKGEPLPFSFLDDIMESLGYR